MTPVVAVVVVAVVRDAAAHRRDAGADEVRVLALSAQRVPVPVVVLIQRHDALTESCVHVVVRVIQKRHDRRALSCSAECDETFSLQDLSDPPTR